VEPAGSISGDQLEEFVIRRARDKSGAVRVTFALPVEAAKGPVSVVGDFNDWTPGKHALVKRANGTRSATVTLPPGTVARFRYLGEGGHWFDDTDADRIDDQGSVLLV
jgi:1,4-alpha-glucan branching enzyme